jgi:hypothetical protein
MGLFRVVFWDILLCKMTVDRCFRGAECRVSEIGNGSLNDVTRVLGSIYKVTGNISSLEFKLYMHKLFMNKCVIAAETLVLQNKVFLIRFCRNN